MSYTVNTRKPGEHVVIYPAEYGDPTAGKVALILARAFIQQCKSFDINMLETMNEALQSYKDLLKPEEMPDEQPGPESEQPSIWKRLLS